IGVVLIVLVLLATAWHRSRDVHTGADFLVAGRKLTWPVLVFTLLVSCGNDAPPPKSAAPQLAKELVFYDWVGDMPQSVLDAFAAEHGVSVRYESYKNQEEAIENMQAGKVYDVVVLSNERVPQMVSSGFLAPINYQNVPNFKNIQANFRDLAYDPGNKFSIPFNWGTIGMVIRGDLVSQPIASWADLWELELPGKIGIWAVERELIGCALKSLGYSANTEDPKQLDAALDRLLQLKEKSEFLDLDLSDSSGPLLKGDFVVTVAYALDTIKARKENPAVTYVLPREGTMLWGDNFVIPANSPSKVTAEVFLNFLLRPEINARIANENFYATPNGAARSHIVPEVLNDPVIFPPDEAIRNAEIILPLSAEGQRLYDEMWNRFLDMTQPEGR
ncbi:MAG: extracellular solute-binding protein, partial [Syntrophobacteraceae bacterium]|nr:extracellular solute-binding protein [Syntrophobacteraceae bacterium]